MSIASYVSGAIPAPMPLAAQTATLLRGLAASQTGIQGVSEAVPATQ